MTKGMIRKALSVIATGALALTGVVGFTAAPAYAADALKIEPAKGGSVWGAPSDDVFTVKASFNSGYSSSGVTDQLNFMVTATGSNAGSFRVNGAASTTLTDVDQVHEVSTSVLAAGATLSAELDAADGSITYAGFEINSAATGTTYTITVQAFVDTDGDDVIDSGEWTSALETISFVAYDEIVLVSDIVNPERGDTSASVSVTSTNISIQELEYAVDGSASGSQIVAVFYDGTTEEVKQLLGYDSTKKYLTATTTGATYTALAAGDSVKVDVYIVGPASAGTDPGVVYAAYDALASNVALISRTESVGTVNASAAGDVATTANASVGATSGNAATVRSGSGSFTVSSEVTFASGKTAGEMSFEIQEFSANSLDSAATVTAGGTTLTNSNAGDQEEFSVAVAVTKDAGVSTGDAELVISYTGLDDGDKFTVVGTIDGYTATKLTLTAADAALNDVSFTNAIGVNDESAQLVFPVGSPVDLTFVAVDQFGSLWTAGGGSISVSDGTKSNTGNIVNGYATVTLSKYTAATTKTFTPTLKYDGVDVSITEPTMSAKIGTAGVAGSVTITAQEGTTSSSPDTLNLKTQKAADTRAGAGSVSITSGADTELRGQLADSNGAGIAGLVTFTAAGVMFEHDGVYSLGSMTIATQSTGAYDGIYAHSNTAGKVAIIATSGAASATEDVYYAQAIDDTGSVLTVSAPAYALPGSSFSVTITLTDKFGNPIDTNGTNTIADTGADFKVTYTGPGLIVGSLPTQTDSSGKATFSVLLGTNDTGSVSITASYDYNDDLDYADDLDLNVTKSVTVGADPGVQKVNAGSFKGYVAVYARGYEGQRLSAKVGADWVIVDPIVNNQENGTLFRVVEFTGAGVDIAVRIYIDRVLVDTIALTTK